MTRRRPPPRIYTRDQGGERRYYADFRHFGDVGGRQEALIAEGAKRATTDPQVAEALYVRRVAEYQRHRLRAVHGLPQEVTLTAFGREHLIAKANAGRVTDAWLVQAERHLRRAAEQFGAARELSTIDVKDVRTWDAALQAMGLSGSSRRHHLNTLSNLYRRAQAEGHVVPGYNPVGAQLEKPSARREEARWLEVHDAALLLEAARLYVPKRGDLAMPFAYPLLAAFLLTGGRRLEVLGLEVGDVSFDRKSVTFRPNEWRRLKTLTSFRTIPLWPQLEEALRPYVFGERPPSRLLFPSYRTGEESLVTDFRKLLDAIAGRAGWEPGEITSKMFRHTYTAARLQTLDNGAPVSVYTVAKELGHGGDSMVKRVYGHLGQVRHRAAVLEYRVEQHREALGERLATLARV